MSGFNVQIREREDPNQDYKRPELLKKAIEEIEAEVAAEAEKSGESDSDVSSSYDSDEDEDDDANLLTPAVDSQIFKTIAAIQAKDPRVYENNTKFFDETNSSSVTTKNSSSTPKDKKITLKDYERKILLENGGFINEYEEGATGKTHRQEQEELRNAFKSAADSDEEEDEDGFLTKKDKTTEEEEAEEDDYRKFLLENMKDDEPSKQAFEKWSSYKENPNVKPEDAFLMDYVLNRGWVDKKGSKTAPELVAVDEVDKDEADLDDIDRFESKYNFRFEEEGSSMIKTYARDAEGSVRRKESKRARRREREKLKKAAMKEQKMEQLKQQKNEKMKEIHAKLKEIKAITGNKAVGLENIDLDTDFDPSAYDAQMTNVFNDDYYGGEEGEENIKPTWDDDIETGLPDEDYDEDITDADYLPGGEKYQGASIKQEQGEARNAPAQLDAKSAAAKRKFDDLMEEYYALNYEDVIGGDIYTRFKYTKTEPENYGLTAEEILLADDAELNKYIGMKALAPYRPEKKRARDEKIFKTQQKNKKKELKKNIKKAAKQVEKEVKKLAKEDAKGSKKRKKDEKVVKKAKKEKSDKKEKKKVHFAE